MPNQVLVLVSRVMAYYVLVFAAVIPNQALVLATVSRLIKCRCWYQSWLVSVMAYQVLVSVAGMPNQALVLVAVSHLIKSGCW